MSDVRVAVFAFEGISLFHLSVPGMVLNNFNDETQPPSGHLEVDLNAPSFYDINKSPNYRISYFALNPSRLRSDQGIEIEINQGLEVLADADIVIIPAWSDPEKATPTELSDALRQANKENKLIVGLCLGAFALGDAGLLDDREATTHWAARDTFARRFPNALFRPDVLYVDDGNIVTSAGTVAAIDCCLHLVRQRHGSEVANHMARLLVTPPHRPGGQAQYIERPVAQIASEHRLPGVLEWARNNLSEPLSVDALAEVAHMSRRTFTRRFKEATGTTVIKWVNAERIAQAQRLLETTQLSIEQIATEVGFGSALSLRQQFSSQLGTSPSAYRRTFFNRLH